MPRRIKRTKIKSASTKSVKRSHKKKSVKRSMRKYHKRNKKGGSRLRCCGGSSAALQAQALEAQALEAQALEAVVPIVLADTEGGVVMADIAGQQIEGLITELAECRELVEELKFQNEILALAKESLIDAYGDAVVTIAGLRRELEAEKRKKLMMTVPEEKEGVEEEEEREL